MKVQISNQFSQYNNKTLDVHSVAYCPNRGNQQGYNCQTPEGIMFFGNKECEIIADADWREFSLYSPRVAKNSKIPLIKLIREIAAKVNSGELKTSMYSPTSPKTMTLADAKEFVEKYKF